MAGIDTNRTSSGLVLPPELSNEIWSDAQTASAVMSVATPMTLPGAGVEIQLITGDPSASWVNETDEIDVSKPTFGSRTIQGYKLGVIELFSNEFKRDKAALYDQLAARLPGALSAKFDSTVLHGPVPGSGFDTLASVEDSVALSADTAYSDLVDIDAAVSAANGVLDGFVLSPKAKSELLRAVDGNERPLLVNDVATGSNVARLLGAPTRFVRNAGKAATTGETPAPELYGYAGDWTGAFYGIVQDIAVSISEESSVTYEGEQINLWQRDMFALKATVHLGFAVRDLAKFVKVTAG